MTYLSVCSGIEAATVAWHPLGWTPVAFSEIDTFPSAVLAHHYPSVPNYGDLTRFQEWPLHAVDVLVGGTPCQSFSVAGLRAGMADPRGNLALVYLGLVDRYRPEWVVWENVPGVLSSTGGRDFGAFLGALGELGYGWAYRVLDAQYFGVAQRRRRVFVVGHRGDWRRAAAVLFESPRLRGNPPARGEKGKVAPTIPSRRSAGGFNGNGDFEHDGGLIPEIAATLETTCHDYSRADGFNMIAERIDPKAYGLKTANTKSNGWGVLEVAGTLDSRNAGGFQSAQSAFTLTKTDVHGVAVPHAFAQNQAGEVRIGNVTNTLNTNSNATGRNAPLIAVPHAFDARQSSVIQYGDKTGPLDTDGHSMAMAFDLSQITSPVNKSRVSDGLPAPTMNRAGQLHLAMPMAVRRLTPRECERLQGFPDDYTEIPYRGKPAADGPRYKALGNSMAVPVMRWIGERIDAVAKMTADATGQAQRGQDGR